MVAKMVPNGRDPGRGLPSKIRVSHPLGLSPSQLPLKSTPKTSKVLRTLSGTSMLIYPLPSFLSLLFCLFSLLSFPF